MTEKPSPLIGTLVRFWDNGFQRNIATEWLDWQDGWFHLYADSPLAQKLNEAALGNPPLMATVYSTEELVWAVDSTVVTNTWGRPYMTVHCVPWLERMRHTLVSDDYMVWLWLDAEKRHLEAS